MKLQFLMWREWRSRPGRAILTICSVAFAVVVVFGSSLAASMVRRAYANISNALEGPPAVDIIAANGGRFAADEVPRLDDVEGVQEIAPLLLHPTFVHLAGKRWHTMVLGLSEPSAPAWSRLRLKSGRLPQRGDEALMDAGVAESCGVALPQRFAVLGRRGITKLTLVGTVASVSLQEYGDGVTLVVPLARARKIFRLANQLDRIRAFVETRDDCDEVQKQFAARIPATLIARKPAGRVRMAEDILQSTELALQFGGMLALAMAAFIILNTLRMNFSERRWQFAVMRAIGATSSQVQRLVMIEGLWFGVLGLIFGVPGGLLLAYVLSCAMQALLHTNLPPTQPGVETFVLGCSVGPLVAILAAWLTARQSRRLSPLEGIIGVEPSGLEHYPRKALLLSLSCWLLAAGVLVAVARGNLQMQWAIPAGLLMLVAFIFLIPAVLHPFTRVIVWLMRGSLATLGLLASRQAEQRTTRMGLTIGVLVVALCNGIGLGHAILNNVDDVRSWYRRTMAGDYFLQKTAVAAPAAQAAPLADSSGELREMPGVLRMDTISLRRAAVNDEPVTCVAREFSSSPTLPWQLSSAEELQVRKALENRQLIVSSVLARRLSLHRNDTIRLELAGRVHSVVVAAIVSDYMFGGQVVFLDRGAAKWLSELNAPQYYLLTRAPDAPIGLEDNLRKYAASHNLLLQSFADLRSHFDSLINGVVGSLFVLMAIGFVVGGLGVSNTLAMGVLEQTRELGLLRIVGMTRGQVRRLILVEGMLIGLIGISLGTIGGATTAYVIHVCNWALLGHHVAFAVHGWLLSLSVVGCLFVTLTAAWTPARQASQIDLLTAITYE